MELAACRGPADGRDLLGCGAALWKKPGRLLYLINRVPRLAVRVPSSPSGPVGSRRPSGTSQMLSDIDDTLSTTAGELLHGWRFAYGAG